MKLIELKSMIDELVKDGHGDKELLMDNEPDVEFDIEFIEYREHDDGTPYVGIRTNDNY